jgi:hypothetical protein
VSHAQAATAAQAHAEAATQARAGAEAAQAEAPAATKQKRKKILRGRERLEHAAYTRKRLRVDHNWMNRQWELKGDPYNFNSSELEVIMAFYPGQLNVRKGERGMIGLFKQQ